MSNLTITPTVISGVIKIHRTMATDERGMFARLFCSNELAEAGWQGKIAQINHSLTHRIGSIRGLHFQHPPMSEIKFVSCVRGKVFDVAVDLRKNSPTFLKYVAVELDAAEGSALMLPKGVAHGFQVLQQDSELIYCHSTPYSLEFEDGVNPLDPKLNICWPLPIEDISEKDLQRTMLSEEYKGIEV